VQKTQPRHPRITLFLKIVVVAAIVTATVLAVAQDQETVELRSAISAEDPAAPEYLSTLVAADLVAGNAYDVLVNGDHVFPAMLRAIESAKERISFETYIYDKGRVADEFTDALEKAARRGVTVNIILDALGTGSMEKSHFERLQKGAQAALVFSVHDEIERVLPLHDGLTVDLEPVLSGARSAQVMEQLRTHVRVLRRAAFRCMLMPHNVQGHMASWIDCAA